MTESHSFRRFLESLHTSRDEREHAGEFDLAALAALRGEERERAETLLLERMRSVPADQRVFSSLELVGSAASVEPLRRAVAERSGDAQLRAAMALARVDASFDPTPFHTAALSTGDFVTRSVAARGLAQAPLEAALPPLLEALGDRAFGVRVAAFGALVERLDLAASKADEYGRLRSLASRLLSDLVAVWRPAAEEMRSIVAALRSGRRADELGLGGETVTSTPAELEAVVASLRDRHGARIDLDAVSRLDDVGRRYAETLLLSSLHQGDARVPAALAVLGGEAVATAMREALASARGDFREELTRALDRMQGPHESDRSPRE